MRTSRWARAAMVVAGATALVLTGTTQASAAPTPRNGICEPGEFCYYYNADLTGSISDFTTSVPNYGTTQPSCYEFRTRGKAGYGQCIKNNARSAWNKSSLPVTVFFNSNYSSKDGPPDYFYPGEGYTLYNTYKNNASHRFG